MAASLDHAARTAALARIAGPFLVIAAAAIFARAPTLGLLLPAYMQDGPLVLATGAFTLMAGLAMFGLHHHWDSAAAIALSLLGLAVSVRGAVLLLAPDIAVALAHRIIGAPSVALIAAALVLILGVWLTYAGWFARNHS